MALVYNPATGRYKQVEDTPKIEANPKGKLKSIASRLGTGFQRMGSGVVKGVTFAAEGLEKARIAGERSRTHRVATLKQELQIARLEGDIARARGSSGGGSSYGFGGGYSGGMSMYSGTSSTPVRSSVKRRKHKVKKRYGHKKRYGQKERIIIIRR